MAEHHAWYDEEIQFSAEEEMASRVGKYMMLQAIRHDCEVPSYIRLDGRIDGVSNLEELFKEHLSNLGVKVVARNFFGAELSSIVAADADTYFAISWSKSKRVSLQCCSRSPVVQKAMKELRKKFRKKKNGARGRVHAIIRGRHGLIINTVGYCGVSLVKENYSPAVLSDLELIRKNFLLAKPRGRLVIISGEKGTGKTHLLRALLLEKGLRFLFLPSKMVDQVLSPEFMPTLLAFSEASKKPMVFVIEDGDLLLLKRGTDNMSLVSSLLDASDGIYANLLNVRIVVTTNTTPKDMDSAITRDGRMFKHVVVDSLSADDASGCLRRILSEIAPEVQAPLIPKMTLASIYAKAYEIEQSAKRAAQKS